MVETIVSEVKNTSLCLLCVFFKLIQCFFYLFTFIEISCLIHLFQYRDRFCCRDKAESCGLIHQLFWVFVLQRQLIIQLFFLTFRGTVHHILPPQQGLTGFVGQGSKHCNSKYCNQDYNKCLHKFTDLSPTESISFL